MTGFSSIRPRVGKIAMLATSVTAGVLADLASKSVARSLFSIHDPIAVAPGFNFSLGFNRGIAFGLFPAESIFELYFMFATQLLLLCGLLFMFFRVTHFLMRLFLASIIAGAFANFFDRMLYGRVTDFIDLYIGDWHWPAFNLADIFICVGVIGLIITDAMSSKKVEIART
jgi:signal peptidase II